MRKSSKGNDLRTLPVRHFQLKKRTGAGFAEHAQTSQVNMACPPSFGSIMHAITLAELASTFVGVAATILKLRILPAQEAAQSLWTLHRSRCDEWNYRLASHRDAINHSGASARTKKWHEVMPVLQEILLTEPLTRTLACFAAQLEELHVSDEFAALFHSMLVSHIEARHRCLNLIVFGQGLSVESAVRLNRLRRNLESYSDQLLAVLPQSPSVEAYCFDAQVVLSRRHEVGQFVDSPDAKWLQLHVQSLERQLWKNVQSDIDWRAANGRLNHRLSQCILALLPRQLFDGFGLPHRTGFSMFMHCDSPESDGKPLDPAASSSPMYLFVKSTRHSRTVNQPHGRKRW